MTVEVQLSDGSRVRIATNDPQAAVAAARQIDARRVRAGPGVDPGPSVGATRSGGLINSAEPSIFTDPVRLPTPDPGPNPGGVDVLRELGLRQDQLVRGGRIGVQGLGEGVADILGAPGDVSDLLSTANTGIQDFLGEALFGAESAAAARKARESAPGVPQVLPRSEDLKRDFGDLLRGAFGGDVLLRESKLTPGERIIKSANEFGAEALLGTTGLIHSAARRAAVPGVRPQGPITSEVAGGGGGRLVSGDTAAGAGAGANLQAFQETNADDFVRENFGPGGEVLANIGAAVTGGIAGLAGAGAVRRVVPGLGPRIAPVPPNFRDPNTGELFSDVVADAAAFLAQEAATDPVTAAGRITGRAAELRGIETPEAEHARRVAGVEPETGGLALAESELPTSAALAGDQGFAALEQSARTVDPGPFRNRDAALSSRLRQTVEEIEPGGEGRAFTDEFEARAESRRAEAQERVTAAETSEEALAAQRAEEGAALTAEGSQGESAARRIDESVSETLTAEQQRKNALFDDPAIQGESRGLDFLQEAVEAEIAGVTAGAKAADEIPSGFIARIKRLRELDDETGDVIGAGTATVADLQARRAELSAIQRQARKDGKFALADSAGRLKAAIADDFEALAATGSEAGEAAQAALTNFGERFGPAFARGQGDAGTEFRKAFNQSRFERTTTPPSQTAERFIAPASPERAQSLARIRELSASPDEAVAAARQFLIADMISAGVVDAKTGAVNGVRLGKWRAKWGDETLNTAAPGFADEVSSLVGRADEQGASAAAFKAETAAARDAARLTDQEISRGALSFAIGRSPANAAAEIFKPGGDPARRAAAVRAEIGDDAAALSGFKQSVREWLLDTRTNAENGLAEGRPLSANKMSQLFNKHVETLAEVFDETEMNNLRQVHAILRDDQIVKSANALPGSQTTPRAEALKRAERTLEATLKLKYGVLKGGGLMRAFKIAAEAIPGSGFKSTVQRAITQMSLDPELAAHLLRRPVGGDGKAWTAQLQRLLVFGESVRAASEPEPGDE